MVLRGCIWIPSWLYIGLRCSRHTCICDSAFPKLCICRGRGGRWIAYKNRVSWYVNRMKMRRESELRIECRNLLFSVYCSSRQLPCKLYLCLSLLMPVHIAYRIMPFNEAQYHLATLEAPGTRMNPPYPDSLNGTPIKTPAQAQDRRDDSSRRRRRPWRPRGRTRRAPTDQTA